MDLNRTAAQLAAAAEPSRLRLLVALLGGETSVGNLVAVLEQSQPRVSRHLRLLTESGLLESFREGRSIFYRWSAEGQEAGVVRSIAAVAASGDPTITRDRERLQKLSRRSESDALRRALRTGRGGGLHAVPVDAALKELLRAAPSLAAAQSGSQALGDVLVVGCGSGELLRLVLPDARLAVGAEASAHRRQVARARLREARLPRWTIRAGEPGQLPFAAAAFDVVILQDVLGPTRGTDRPAVLREAARVLKGEGRLLILDHILPTDNELAAALAALGLVVTRRQWLPGRTPDRALFLASRPETPHARTGTHD